MEANDSVSRSDHLQESQWRPVLGGLLVATAGPAPAFAVDAASFAVSALALALLRPRPRAVRVINLMIITVWPLSYRAAVRQTGMMRTGRALRPLVKLDRIRRGCPASSNRATRRASAASTIRTSSRARWAPRHRCGPPRPKLRCRLGARPTSNTSGPANSVSSLLPDTYQSTTLSPALIAAPPRS